VFVDDPDSEEGYAEVFKATATRQLHLSDCIIGMGKTKFKPEALRMVGESIDIMEGWMTKIEEEGKKP
jgi:hypothetical protein